MKKFAKISAVLAAMVLAFAFSGCSDGSSGSGSDDSSEITGNGTSGNGTSGNGTSGNGTSGGETSGGETSSGRDENGQLIVYSITYKNVENATNDNPASYTIETETVTLKEATKDGFVFLGWYTDSKFVNKTTEIEKGSTGEKTLYAQWWNSTDFVKVPAVSIKGSESWTQDSNVFVKGRALNLKAFYMSDHEVTQAEWKAVMGKLPSNGMASAYGNTGNNPVNYISWYAAIVYCNKRSIDEGLKPCYTIRDSAKPDDWGSIPVYSNSEWNAATCDFTENGYRLPTEAEWEWAARGEQNYKYSGSGDINKVAWMYDSVKDFLGTKEVKTKSPNGYGLYDMSGNVYEWCWDWWSENISGSTLATGVSSGSSRVMRGGGWGSEASNCEIAYRIDRDPIGCSSNIGFRVVRSCD